MQINAEALAAVTGTGNGTETGTGNAAATGAAAATGTATRATQRRTPARRMNTRARTRAQEAAAEAAEAARVAEEAAIAADEADNLTAIEQERGQEETDGNADAPGTEQADETAAETAVAVTQETEMEDVAAATTAATTGWGRARAAPAATTTGWGRTPPAAAWGTNARLYRANPQPTTAPRAGGWTSTRGRNPPNPEPDVARTTQVPPGVPAGNMRPTPLDRAPVTRAPARRATEPRRQRRMPNPTFNQWRPDIEPEEEPINVFDEARNDEERLYQCLTTVLNFTTGQAETLMDDGYKTIKDFEFWPYDEIQKWATDKTKLAARQGGRPYSAYNTKKLQGLAWWVTDNKLRKHTIEIEDFTQDTLKECMIEARNEYDERENRKSSDLSKPEKFKSDTWIAWEQSLYNYLGQIYNARGVPLSYVIYQQGINMYGVTRKADKERVDCADTEGSIFERDTQRVLKIIQELTLDTPAADWIKNIECGRAAMKALQNHFDGEGEGERRKAQANAEINTLFYRNEQSFSFEKFATKLKSCFDVLERYNLPKHEEEKVNILLDKIQTSSTELRTAISLCREGHSNTFLEAVTFIQTNVSRMFPQHVNSRNGRRRQIHASGRGGRSGRGFGGNNYRGRGRGRGRGNSRSYDHYGPSKNESGNKRQFDNGIDITDKTRYYHDYEWNKLSQQAKTEIFNHPKRAKAIEKRKREDRGVSAYDSTPNTGTSITIEKDQLSQIVANAARAVISSAGTSESTSNRRNLNGSRAVSSVRSVSRSGNSDTTPSDITYDQYGNRA